MPNHPAIAQPERESLAHKAALPDRVLWHLQVAGVTEKFWTEYYFDGHQYFKELHKPEPDGSGDSTHAPSYLERFIRRITDRTDEQGAQRR